jgi:hypothetical protein
MLSPPPPLLPLRASRVAPSALHALPMAGLVDGNVSYPFDVNEIIVQLAASVDLVLVFLDPMGQVGQLQLPRPRACVWGGGWEEGGVPRGLDLLYVLPLQALCSRTMAVVEALNKRGYSKKVHYFLTKVGGPAAIPCGPPRIGCQRLGRRFQRPRAPWWQRCGPHVARPPLPPPPPTPVG